MKYRYGGFTFDEGECSLDSSESAMEYAPYGGKMLLAVTHNCSGEIIPPSSLTTDQDRQQWIQTRMEQIEFALAIDGQEGVLLNNDGSPSHNLLTNLPAITITGPRVVKRPSWGKLDQADGVTGRSFSFALRAEYDQFNSGQLHSWRQSVSWQGDAGPEFVPVELDSGTPDIQQVRQKTVQRIIQRGSAVGLGSYPAFPDPVYPTLPRGARPVIEQEDPIRRGHTDLLYPIRWQYVMLSANNEFALGQA